MDRRSFLPTSAQLAGAAWMAHAAGTGGNPVVTTASGKVRGVRAGGGIDVFKGILLTEHLRAARIGSCRRSRLRLGPACATPLR